MRSYAAKHYAGTEPLNFSGLIYKRIDVNEALKEIGHCDVVGFSAYVWNIKLSLKIAKELRNANPSCLIIFGGPQVPDKAEEFLRENTFIDIVVHGEGEQAFTEILTRYTTRDFSDISSASYMQKDGIFVRSPRYARIKSLDDIPSPYLTDTFKQIVESNTDEKWIAMWETNRGCPFSCTFCDWGSAVASKLNQFGLDRLYEEVKWFSDNKIEFVNCCDANFGILPRDLEIAQHVVEVKEKTGYPNAMSVQNTKNSTERAYLVQKILADAGLNTGVTISMQSMDEQTLRNVKRANISTKSFQELQRRFTKDTIATYTDMIPALPGETYNTFADGIDSVIENGQHNRIQFHNLSLLPNSEMSDTEYRKKFGITTVTSKIINMHGSLAELEDESTQELQDLVIATDSMPRPDWVKTRSYCWMVALLHFNKLFQIPLVLSHYLGKIKYRKIFEAFMNKEILEEFPILSEIRTFFAEKAQDIQNGGSEYCESKEWLNIFWYADEYVFIKLAVENKIEQFYDESHRLLKKVLADNATELPDGMLEDAILLNKTLLKLPFDYKNETVRTHYNISELYESMVANESIPVDASIHDYLIQKDDDVCTTWEQWFREVVWFGNKRGAYLHANTSFKQMEGHY
jgi:radical SAM superfamily enzyme YgiQ (UPF0313 family)